MPCQQQVLWGWRHQENFLAKVVPHHQASRNTSFTKYHTSNNFLWKWSHLNDIVENKLPRQQVPRVELLASSPLCRHVFVKLFICEKPATSPPSRIALRPWKLRRSYHASCKAINASSEPAMVGTLEKTLHATLLSSSLRLLVKSKLSHHERSPRALYRGRKGSLDPKMIETPPMMLQTPGESLITVIEVKKRHQTLKKKRNGKGKNTKNKGIHKICKISL